MTAVDPSLRAYGYRVLSEIFLKGVSGDTLPFLADSLPAEVFPGGVLPGPDDIPVDRDDAAAEHFRVFSRGVHPYGSVFLEPEGTLGGGTTSALERIGLRLGVDPLRRSEPADHLGRVLELLALATEAGREDVLRRIVDGHLLRWLPPFCAALARQNEPLWSGAASLVLEAVLDHREEWGRADASGTVESGEGRSLPVVDVEPSGSAVGDPEDFDGKDFDPRGFAHRLSSAHRSGLYLGESEIRRIGRAGELPAGFGARAVVLENLLGSAITYDAVTLIEESIVERIRADREAYRWMVEEIGLPKRFAAPWLGRLGETEAYLRALEAFAARPPER